MWTIDLDKFKSLPRIVNSLTDGRGNHCTMGALIVACGHEITDFWAYNSPLRYIQNYHHDEWFQAVTTNNNGEFEKADRMTINLALKSGMFKLSGSEELIREFRQECDKVLAER